MASEKVSASLNFAPQELILAGRGVYTGVLFARGAPAGAPGAPALPWRKVYLAVPAGARLGELAIGAMELGLLADGILVEPIQPNLPTLLGTQPSAAPPDPEIYESDDPWPAMPARVTALRRLGHQALAEIEVCPVRYYPRSRRLELVAHLELTLYYAPTDRPPEAIRAVDELAYSKKMADRAAAMVLNPDDVGRFRLPAALDAPARFGALPQVDYVIITNDNLAGAFGALAQWRSQMGLQARVVRVDDIISNQVPDTGGAIFNHAAGYWDGGTRDAAETIRNFVKWAALHWNTDYVLLGGDTDVIPARHALSPNVGSLFLGDFDVPNLNRQVGAAPLASSEQPGWPAADVRDDQTATAWRPTAADAGPWIRLTLGAHTPLNHLTLTWGANFATGYRVAVSDDGVNWTDVYSTTTGAGGVEQIAFPCVSTGFVRLSITSGNNFTLATIGAYGPWADWAGIARQATATRTRAHLGFWVDPNPANDAALNRLLVLDGPNAGAVIPYDEHSDDVVLGWHFVDDLLAPAAAVSPAPTPFLEVRGPAAFHGQALVMACDINYIAADLYYSDVAAAEYPPSVEHDWDPDRNEIYGERYGGELDGVNGMADVYLGRAPVDSEGDAWDFVDKVIRYERYVDQADHPLPPDFAASVLLGSENWQREQAGSLDLSAAGKEDIRHSYLAAAPGRFLFTRRYEDLADVPAADLGPDLGAAGKGPIVNAIQAGSHVVSLTSHGSPGYLCYLESADVQGLANSPGIWYGNACLTNKFDVTPGEAISEWAVLNSHGGGAAYVGNSRFGWMGDNPIELAFWDEMLHSGVLGEMFDACKQVAGNWGKYSLNLLGDPAMRVWSDRPLELEIGVHPEELCIGRNNAVTVSVFAAGNPLAGALVAVSQNGALLAKGTTGAGGRVVLNVVPPGAGAVYVAVYGKNLIPVIRELQVTLCPPDYCALPVACTELVCTAAESCAIRILCGEALVCRVALFCSHGLPCLHELGCMGRVEPELCPALRPDEMDIFQHIREIWGIREIDDFLRLADGPEFERKMALLPVEIRKPIRLLLERLREEG
jgi:hypothetical protein